ncbi:MAG: hypothetical protein JWO52_4544 [Gammaproteobacteria bacterium]|jgi:hypothetical protein|nr:hypothetical protein [Gammaproteobacteria bacterium]
MICHVIGADFCQPLQGEHWRLNFGEALRGEGKGMDWCP